jgi:molybdate transport system substrate-binding protein
VFKALMSAAALLVLMGIHAKAWGADRTAGDDRWSPPWQHGANNDALDRGLEFTVPDADNLADFHGSPVNPLLALYVGGNYFFAMAPLVETFERIHPQYRGRLYWETIPPGLLMKQLKAGGTITVGNMTWTVKPDVYLAGLKKVQEFVDDGTLEPPAVPYVTNTLTIMIAKGNPSHITRLADLAQPQLRLAMPNPEFEGIVHQIKDALNKAGGPSLSAQVYETKVKDGTTVLTHIHHRQTPLWIMQGRSDAGVTWQSEALFQEQIGHPIAHVDIPPAENSTAVYGGAIVKGAAHEKAAHQWLDFIRSPQALAIFERYGFKAYAPAHAP